MQLHKFPWSLIHNIFQSHRNNYYFPDIHVQQSLYKLQRVTINTRHFQIFIYYKENKKEPELQLLSLSITLQATRRDTCRTSKSEISSYFLEMDEGYRLQTDPTGRPLAKSILKSSKKYIPEGKQDSCAGGAPH